MTYSTWTDAENAATIALYFAMLDKAMTGQPYNKAAMIREYRGENHKTRVSDMTAPLAARSRGAIEFKLMNASAAHAALIQDAVTMDVFGYRALSNYQAGLKAAMLNELLRRDTN